MPFFRCPDSYMFIHVKTGYRKKEYCACGMWAHVSADGFLCDFIVGKRTKTCDAPMCWECALMGAIRTFENKGGNRDVVTFCPKHFNEYLATGREERSENIRAGATFVGGRVSKY